MLGSKFLSKGISPFWNCPRKSSSFGFNTIHYSESFKSGDIEEHGISVSFPFCLVDKLSQRIIFELESRESLAPSQLFHLPEVSDEIPA